MRPSIQDRSSLFLLRGPHTAAEPHDEYIFQANGANRGAAGSAPDLFEFGVAPRRASGHPLAAAVGRALATEESTFFGDVQGFALLISLVLPALMSTRGYGKSLRLWLAGCATGQEAYSAAITLAELCPALAKWDIEIVASEADAAALARAKRGIYSPSEVQRGLPTEWLVRHFEELPARHGWRFNSPLAPRMRWLQLDLAQSCAQVGVADIVICHQKLASGAFDWKARRELLGRLTDQLASDGCLILRSSEPALECAPGFESVCIGGSAIYRRVHRDTSLLSA